MSTTTAAHCRYGFFADAGRRPPPNRDWARKPDAPPRRRIPGARRTPTLPEDDVSNAVPWDDVPAADIVQARPRRFLRRNQPRRAVDRSGTDLRTPDADAADDAAEDAADAQAVAPKLTNTRPLDTQRAHGHSVPAAPAPLVELGHQGDVSKDQPEYDLESAMPLMELRAWLQRMADGGVELQRRLRDRVTKPDANAQSIHTQGTGS